jgi:hypothetical protein
MIEPIEELEELKIQWYYNTAVQFEIVKAMNQREGVFLATRHKLTNRCLKINAVRFLVWNFERYNFFSVEHCFNIYNSVAKFPEMPMFSFKFEEKREAQQLWNLKAAQFIRAYDFVFDIDNPDLEKSYETAVKLNDLLKRFNITFYRKFSGTKGLHFVIPYEFLPEKIKTLSWVKMCELFEQTAYELKVYHGLTDIDLKIYDLRRIWKTPYSVVYPYYYVAMPLTDEQFDNFKLADVWLPNVLKNIDSIKNRGLCLSKGEDPDGVINFIRYVAEKQRLKYNLSKTFKMTKKFLIDSVEEIM